ncbi:zinc-dependent alcohol dehydrogenase [Phytoactinopolyspora limicola]|uniref:zinc-dependent alcohol dehydrogenase n=1 Tax=Phytoactinopolyspora limicola TaxID=2715536 RepID=UPI00140CDCEF|nr:alcohol dehydrogenase catalytic domain-containing protein [Phytoactinopolyspora limicola]
MRALVFNGAWDLAVTEIPEPAPGEGEVLIRVIATGICGSDIHGYTGKNGRRFPGQIMGHETVGRIETLGPGVPTSSGLHPGTLVTVNPVIGCSTCPACTGGQEQRCADRQVIGVTPEIQSAFADLFTAPATNVVALPDSIRAEIGALT